MVYHGGLATVQGRAVPPRNRRLVRAQCRHPASTSSRLQYTHTGMIYTPDRYHYVGYNRKILNQAESLCPGACRSNRSPELIARRLSWLSPAATTGLDRGRRCSSGSAPPLYSRRQSSAPFASCRAPQCWRWRRAPVRLGTEQ